MILNLKKKKKKLKTFEFVIVGLPTFVIIKVSQMGQNKKICSRMTRTKPKTNTLLGLKKIVMHEQSLGYLSALIFC